MTEKTVKSLTEIQLGFSFFNDAELSVSLSSPGAALPPRTPRSGSKPRGLAETLATARAALLDAPISEVSTQLLPLFEFCEAALTRALDVVPARTGEPFSPDEYRSLRGIGQAQWLLTEEHGKREAKAVASRGRKTKRVKSKE